MSLAMNKKLKNTYSDVSKQKTEYPKDSMDRFGDDLAELVLSYQSIEDKVNQECVSKQWRRIIYNKVTKLLIDELFVRVNKEDKYVDNISTEVLEGLLQKCPHIRNIRFSNSVIHTDPDDCIRFFSLIIQYCSRLNEFQFILDIMPNQIFQEFFTKFGEHLKRIEITGYYIDDKFRRLVKLCPNLQYIKCSKRKISEFFDEIDDNQCLVSKLKYLKYRITVNDDSGKESIDRLRKIIDNNKNTLKSVALDLQAEDYWDSDESDVEGDEEEEGGKYMPPLSWRFDLMQHFSKVCGHLSKLDIDLFGQPFKTVQPIYELLGCFKSLRHLRFLCDDTNNLLDPYLFQLFQLPDLVHLELKLDFEPLTDAMIAQIVKTAKTSSHSIQEIKYNRRMSQKFGRS